VLRSSFSSVVAAAALLATVGGARAQQPEVSLSPFVTFLPTGSARPMAGLSLTLAGGPLALRAGGHIAVEEYAIATANGASPPTRPWGADVDALAFLDSYDFGERIGFTPYVFLGVSTAAVDSGLRRSIRPGWSYGAGLSLPVASVLGVFAEARWRMSKYVLPNATDAPPTGHEFRAGISLHVGRSGATNDAARASGRADDDVEADGPPTTGYNAVRVVNAAEQYIGTPYRRGGTSPSSGFDASGFVRFVFSRFGVNLPRTSRDQARVGERVRPDWRSIVPGDLLMFEDGGGINHVAIYVGQRQIIHSSATGGGVRLDDLDSDRGQWFADHLVAVRRVSPDLRGLLLDLARGYATDVSGNSDGPDHAPRATMMKRRP